MSALASVAAMDHYLLTRSAEGPSPAQQEVDLRYEATAFVDQVEPIRPQQGRVSAAEDASDELNGDDRTRAGEGGD